MTTKSMAKYARESGDLPVRREGMWHPFWDTRTMFGDLFEDLDRFLDRPFSMMPLMPRRFFRPRSEEEAMTWMPRIDMVKKDDHLLVRADLPGMTKDAVEVTLDNGDLVLSGERKEETEDTEDNYYRCERHYGSFYRRLPLPFEVDAKMIKANFKEGVLEVKVPMPPEVVQKAQKISIH